MTCKQVCFALNVVNKFVWNLSLNIAVLRLCLCTFVRVNCCWFSTAQSSSVLSPEGLLIIFFSLTNLGVVQRSSPSYKPLFIHHLV